MNRINLRKATIAITAAVAATLAGALAAPDQAEAKGGKVAGALLGGLVIGAIIGAHSRPAYSAPYYAQPRGVVYQRCHWEKRRVGGHHHGYHGHGRWQNVKVCY